MDTNTKQDLPWVRASQLSALRDAVLPSVSCRDGKSVSGAAMKAVLRCIDSRAGENGSCWASVPRLCVDAGLGRRTVLRALEGLRALSLLIEVEDPDVSQRWHRRVAWSNLEDFRGGADAGGGPGNGPENGAGGNSGTGATVTRTGATVTRTGATVTRTGATVTRTGATVAPEGSMKGTIRKPKSMGTGGVLESGDGGTASPGVPGASGWTLKAGLEPAELKDGETIAELWGRVLELELLPDTDYWRETFAGLCFSIWRNRERLRSPIGLLQAKLAAGREAVLAQVDDEHDRKFARALLRPSVAEREAERPGEPMAAELEDRYGAELDRWSREDVIEFLRRQGASPYLRRHFQTSGLSGVVRAWCLRRLAAESARVA